MPFMLFASSDSKEAVGPAFSVWPPHEGQPSFDAEATLHIPRSDDRGAVIVDSWYY